MWYSCSVVSNCWFDNEPITKPVEIADGIFIEPTPEWIKEEEYFSFLSQQDKEKILNSEYVFSKSYEAEALGSLDPEWQGENDRSIQDTAQESFMLVSLALWVVKPSALSCGTLFHFSEKGKAESIRSSGSLNSFRINETELENELSDEEILQATPIFKELYKLNRTCNLWIAIRVLIKALTENMWEARYILQWTILEALYGSNNPQETTYRLSQRIAIFLEENKTKRMQLMKEVKQCYTIRSKAVHGMRLANLTNEESLNKMQFTEMIIRGSLKKILSNPDLIKVFSEKRRDEYLEELVFS